MAYQSALAAILAKNEKRISLFFPDMHMCFLTFDIQTKKQATRMCPDGLSSMLQSIDLDKESSYSSTAGASVVTRRYATLPSSNVKMTW